METELLNRITIISEMLASGMTNEDILDQHPVLEREDIPAALLHATIKTKKTLIIHAA